MCNEATPHPVPQLETMRLVLRTLVPGDTDDIFAYAADPDIAQYTLWSAHTTLEDSRQFLAWIRGGSLACGAIVQPATGQVIGTSFLHSHHARHQRAEIAFNLAKHSWGRGYTTVWVIGGEVDMWRRAHFLQCDRGMLTAVTLYILTRFLPVVDGLDRTGQSVLGVALCGMLLWISEIVPIGVTALAVLVLLGTIPGLHPTHVFAGFALPVVFFLIGAVSIAAAVEQTGLAHRAAHLLLRGARGKPAWLYFLNVARKTYSIPCDPHHIRLPRLPVPVRACRSSAL